MTTQYTHSVTLAVPVALISDANSLACLLGENPAADLGTFKTPRYTDGTTDYAVVHTVVKPVFLAPTQTGTLPPDPADPMPDGYSRAAAQAAFDSLNTPGGILMATDVDPHGQFAAWGLTPKPSQEPA